MSDEAEHQGVTLAGIAFEAPLTDEQARELARLMDEGRATRPAGVVQASLEYANGNARLVAIWKDADTLEAYLAETDVPRGLELMRKVGAEPAIRRFDVLELG